jgi:preprotein translocase subunit SecY
METEARCCLSLCSKSFHTSNPRIRPAQQQDKRAVADELICTIKCVEHGLCLFFIFKQKMNNNLSIDFTINTAQYIILKLQFETFYCATTSQSKQNAKDMLSGGQLRDMPCFPV